jgi:hypothetical protein
MILSEAQIYLYLAYLVQVDPENFSRQESVMFNTTVNESS